MTLSHSCRKLKWESFLKQDILCAVLSLNYVLLCTKSFLEAEKRLFFCEAYNSLKELKIVCFSNHFITYLVSIREINIL